MHAHAHMCLSVCALEGDADPADKTPSQQLVALHPEVCSDDSAKKLSYHSTNSTGPPESQSMGLWAALQAQSLGPQEMGR